MYIGIYLCLRSFTIDCLILHIYVILIIKIIVIDRFSNISPIAFTVINI